MNQVKSKDFCFDCLCSREGNKGVFARDANDPTNTEVFICVKCLKKNFVTYDSKKHGN